MTVRDDWRWTDERGVQRQVGTEDLRTALANAVLPPSTLVWRVGMAAWLPAAQVPELAAVVPVVPASPSGGRPKRVTPTEVLHAATGEIAAKPVGGRPRLATLQGVAAPLPSAQTALHQGAKPAAAGAGVTERRAPSPAAGASTVSSMAPRMPPSPTVPKAPPPVAPRAAPPAAVAAITPPRPQAGARITMSEQVPGKGGGPSWATTSDDDQTLTQMRRATAKGEPPTIEVGPSASLPVVHAPTPAAGRPAAPPHVHPGPVPRRPLPPPAVPRVMPPKSLEAEPVSAPISAPTANPVSAALPPEPVAAVAANGAVAVEVERAHIPSPVPPPRPSAVESAELPPPRSVPHPVAANGVNAHDHAETNDSVETGIRPAVDASVPAAENEATYFRSRSEALLDARRVTTPSIRVHRTRVEPVFVPVSSLIGAGGALIGMVLLAFFAGRCSMERPPVARASTHALPIIVHAAVPEPPRACWVVRQPTMWAPKVSKSIPFDVTATAKGSLAIGYARDANEAVGVEVGPSTGVVRQSFQAASKDDIERVTPTEAAEFTVTSAAAGGPLGATIPVGSAFVLGVQGGAIAVADRPDSAASALWPLAGSEGLGAAQVEPAGERGYALVYRRDGAIWSGWIDAHRKPVGDLVKVAGSGGSVGKPNSGWNGRELAVIFADKRDERWEIRVGRAPGGQVPATTVAITLPAGGPGGDAFAPDIAGLPDGRWLMIWTEGASGSRAVRAQTLDADFAPLGDPLALSPPAGNYGQGVLGVVDGYAGAVFLSKGASAYELWGAILRCG